MRHTSITVIALAFAAVAAAGCADDFLTTTPPDQLSDAVYWQSEKDAVLAVNAIYPYLWDDNLLHLEAASDNGYQNKQWLRAYSYGTGTHDAFTDWGRDRWQESYEAVRRANNVLANIDRVEAIDGTLKERLKGEAAFLRAYNYVYLVNLYGSVPLILTPLTVSESKTVTRAGVGEVVDQIIADLDFAAGVLPVSYGGAALGRATRGAALALKARAALYAGRYDVAAAAAKAVMDLGVYSLHPDYAALFTYAGEGSPEIILARQQIKNQYATGVFAAMAPYSSQGGSDVVPTRSLVDAYLMTDGLPAGQSPRYDPATPFANRDPRLAATVLLPGAEWDDGVYDSTPTSTTADRVGSDFLATATGYNLRKYIDLADKSDRSNGGIDYIQLRYADVLLMYAEARIEQGQIDASVYDAINAVRARVDMPAVEPGRSQAELREIVRHERQVELGMEGLRLFDIRRWRIAESVFNGPVRGIDYVDTDGSTKTIVPDQRRFVAPRDYLWAIPQRERDLNPGLEQNPGY